MCDGRASFLLSSSEHLKSIGMKDRSVAISSTVSPPHGRWSSGRSLIDCSRLKFCWTARMPLAHSTPQTARAEGGRERPPCARGGVRGRPRCGDAGMRGNAARCSGAGDAAAMCGDAVWLRCRWCGRWRGRCGVGRLSLEGLSKWLSMNSGLASSSIPSIDGHSPLLERKKR
eukprot:4488584-Prymnesium_polylepis.1